MGTREPDVKRGKSLRSPPKVWRTAGLIRLRGVEVLSEHSPGELGYPATL
jgi:hypothetical protein